MALQAQTDPIVTNRLHASLPMYDWPEVAAAWDVLWTAVCGQLAEAGIGACGRLVRDGDHHAGWLSPGLILGQACGWPYVSMLRGHVVPLGRLDFGLPTARPADYFSVFVMSADRAGSLDGPRDLAPVLSNPATVIAVNSRISQSGYRVLGECLAVPITVPGRRLVMTGSHRQSIRAVAAGEAHVAAIDAVTWQLACAHEPAARHVAVVARSADTPGLPLIMAAGLARHRDAVLGAVERAVEASSADILGQLGLAGVVAASDEDYLVLCDPPYGNLRVA